LGKFSPISKGDFEMVMIPAETLNMIESENKDRLAAMKSSSSRRVAELETKVSAARDMLIVLRAELQECNVTISGEDYNSPALNHLIEHLAS
jgi:hypothetical protein